MRNVKIIGRANQQKKVDRSVDFGGDGQQNGIETVESDGPSQPKSQSAGKLKYML